MINITNEGEGTAIVKITKRRVDDVAGSKFRSDYEGDKKVNFKMPTMPGWHSG